MWGLPWSLGIISLDVYLWFFISNLHQLPFIFPMKSEQFNTVLRDSHDLTGPHLSRLCFHSASLNLVLGVSHFLTFLELTTDTAYSFQQAALSPASVSSLSLSFLGSRLCPTFCHSESLGSLISLLWHLFKATLCCGCLGICVVKRGPDPEKKDLGFTLFQISWQGHLSSLNVRSVPGLHNCLCTVFSGGLLAKVSNSLWIEI